MSEDPILNKDFRVFKYTPSHEQEVVLLFGLLLPWLPEKFVIDVCSTSFPDCIAWSHDRKEIKIEFEVFSSDFLEHGHDPTRCDLIICWEHDWMECPVQVLELSKIIKDKKIEFIFENNRSKSPVKWTEDRFFEAAGPKPQGFIREFYDFCRKQDNLLIIFGRGDIFASFRLWYTSPNKPKVGLLGVYADGRIWPGFTDENMPEHIRNEYRERLARIKRISDDAKRKQWFTFVIQNEEELKILCDTIQWLVTAKW